MVREGEGKPEEERRRLLIIEQVWAGRGKESLKRRGDGY